MANPLYDVHANHWNVSIGGGGGEAWLRTRLYPAVFGGVSTSAKDNGL